MSDLLTRLAQRALGTAAPAVQPRLPSRFADAPGDASLLLREEDAEVFAPRVAPAPRPAPAAHPSNTPNPVLRRESDAVLRRELDPAPPRETEAVRTREADAVHPAREDAAPRLAVEEPAARPIVPAAGIEQMVEQVVDEHRPAPARSIESPSAAPAAARPVDVDQPRRPAPAAPPVRSAEHAREAGDGGFHPIHVLVEAGDDDELLMPRSSARPSSVVERGEDAGSPPAPRTARPRREAEDVVEVAEVADATAKHGERDADSVAARPSRGSVVRPEAVRVAERPAAHVVEEQPERPVVRVTIGRIEVRAAPPPAQPQPAARPGWKPPVLSLDDYLDREARR